MQYTDQVDPNAPLTPLVIDEAHTLGQVMADALSVSISAVELLAFRQHLVDNVHDDHMFKGAANNVATFCQKMATFVTNLPLRGVRNERNPTHVLVPPLCKYLPPDARRPKRNGHCPAAMASERDQLFRVKDTCCELCSDGNRVGSSLELLEWLDFAGMPSIDFPSLKLCFDYKGEDGSNRMEVFGNSTESEKILQLFTLLEMLHKAFEASGRRSCLKSHCWSLTQHMDDERSSRDNRVCSLQIHCVDPKSISTSLVKRYSNIVLLTGK